MRWWSYTAKDRHLCEQLKYRLRTSDVLLLCVFVPRIVINVCFECKCGQCVIITKGLYFYPDILLCVSSNPWGRVSDKKLNAAHTIHIEHELSWWVCIYENVVPFSLIKPKCVRNYGTQIFIRILCCLVNVCNLKLFACVVCYTLIVLSSLLLYSVY